MFMKNIKKMLSKKQSGSTDIVEIPVSRIEEILEPDDYFGKLKEGMQYLDTEDIENVIANIDIQIEKARHFKQEKLLDYLKKTSYFFSRYHEVLLKGFDRYILFSDIHKYIKQVAIKDSIKFIELERYMRIIPNHVRKKYTMAMESDLFKTFYVLFTDYTHMEKETTSEQEKFIMARNRDPVLFGQIIMSKNDDGRTTDIHDNRLFVIDEWVDENCSLTFDQVIEGLKKNKLISSDNYMKGKIVYDKQDS